MNREVLKKAPKYQPCMENGKNIKPILPASNFGRPISNEKDEDIYYLVCIDHFSIYPYVEVYDQTNGPNLAKLVDEHIQIHGVPRNIRLVQSRCLLGNKVEI